MKRFLLSVMLVAAAVAVNVGATDLAVTAASVVPGARARYAPAAPAGVAITAGQLVYFDGASQSYKLADADASAATANCVGYAAANAAAGQPISVVLEDDDVTMGATMSTSAGVYILSATAGGISPSAALAPGMYPVVVLVAKSTTKGIFRITRGTVPATSYVLPLNGDVPRLAGVMRAGRAVIQPRRDELVLAA